MSLSSSLDAASSSSSTRPKRRAFRSKEIFHDFLIFHNYVFRMIENDD
jgi:hypothetical protein